jgi:integrase
MARLVKRPGRRNWYIVYEEHGKQVWRCAGTDDRDLANDMLREVQATREGRESEDRLLQLMSRVRGQPVPDKRIPVSTVWLLYGKQPKPHSMTDATLRTKKIHVGHWLRWVSKRHPEISYLHEVTESHAAAYFGEQQELAGQTRNNRLSALRDVFRVIRVAAGLQSNIWEAIPRVDKGTIRRSALAVDQVVALYNAAKAFDARVPTFWPASIAIGFHTGLRWGDVCTLEWRELRVEDGIVVLVERKKRRAQKDLALVLHPDFMTHVLEAGECWGTDGFVWPEIADEYLRTAQHNVRWLDDEFRQLCGSVGIQISRDPLEGEVRKRRVKEVGFHSLRHTFVTELLERGVDPRQVQLAVGHGNPAMTEHYSHSLGAVRNIEGKLPSLEKGDSGGN